jgi:hypothetical protein
MEAWRLKIKPKGSLDQGYELATRVKDPDPHYLRKLDPDSHMNKKLDLDPH